MGIKRSPIWKIDSATFKEVVTTKETMTEILQFFGLKNHGSNYSTLENRIREEGIDVDHIKKAQKERRKGNLRTNKLEDDEVFVVNSEYSRFHLKNRIIKDRLLDYVCVSCGNTGEWNGRPLVLTLDHINGINDDNRLENLRFLCPNCHSQTDTFAGRNVRDESA